MQNISKINCKIWSRLGQRGTFFGVALPEIAAENALVWVLTADLADLSGLARFQNAFPERFVNVGIAEQNMLGIAAGLAKEGNTVFATTYATFIAMRSFEQIRHNLGYQQVNVKVVGSAAGMVMGMSGNTHYAFEDLAIMRAIPGMTVVSPADATEAYKLAWAAAADPRPMYIRLTGGLNCASVYDSEYEFVIGKAVTMREGKDLAIIASGTMVREAIMAAEILETRGVSAEVINMHTIKPIDAETIIRVASEKKLIVTVEEHNTLGGLGSAVAEVKSTVSSEAAQLFIGVPDTFTKAATYEYLLERFGLKAEMIAEKILMKIESL
ncbi:MAG: transketolase C-terminal domain-containing protein [Planctomycetia bacterium]|nr:transketolase C-terminal domain-containing protein [Planctomycetia bacterium]